MPHLNASMSDPSRVVVANLPIIKHRSAPVCGAIEEVALVRLACVKYNKAMVCE